MNKKIIIGLNASKKLKYFVELADGEISGFAKSKIKDDAIYIEDFILFKQVCTGATTNLDPLMMGMFIDELMKKEEDPSPWNIWWHSHADMGVFWSPTDNIAIQNDMGIRSYSISLVTNKKGEFKARLDIFPKDNSPFNVSLFNTSELDVEIEVEPDIEIFFSDLSKRKQNELSKIFKDLDDALPIATIPVEEIEDTELEEQCLIEFEANVKEEKVIIVKPKEITNFDSNKPGMVWVRTKDNKGWIERPKQGLSKKQLKRMNRMKDPHYYSKNKSLFNQMKEDDDDILLSSHLEGYNGKPINSRPMADDLDKEKYDYNNDYSLDTRDEDYDTNGDYIGDNPLLTGTNLDDKIFYNELTKGV